MEIIATVFGFLCVWLVVRQSIWCWPTGLIQVSLFVYVFYQAKLYSDMLLHIVYIGVQFYGWHSWLHGGKNHGVLRVTELGSTGIVRWSAFAGLLTIVWGYVMATWTDAAAPYADGFVAVTSLIAQWLQARKKLQSWYFWISVDVVAIVVYLIKALYFTTGLYFAFFVLCILGLKEWRKSLQIQV